MVPEMFLDELLEILKLIGDTYDRKRHVHAVCINKGTIGLTDACKGKKVGWHQVFRNVEIEIKDEKVYQSLKKILDKYSVEYK